MGRATHGRISGAGMAESGSPGLSQEERAAGAGGSLGQLPLQTRREETNDEGRLRKESGIRSRFGWRQGNA